MKSSDSPTERRGEVGTKDARKFSRRRVLTLTGGAIGSIAAMGSVRGASSDIHVSVTINTQNLSPGESTTLRVEATNTGEFERYPRITIGYDPTDADDKPTWEYELSNPDYLDNWQWTDQPQYGQWIGSNANPTPFALSPGETETATVDLTVGSDALRGNHPISVTAYSYILGGPGSDPYIFLNDDTTMVSVQSATTTWELTADTQKESVRPGELVQISPVLTNTGDATTDAAVYFEGATTETTHNADYYGERFDVESHADDGGKWLFEGWQWNENTASGSIAPDATREPSVELKIAEDVPPGEYTFSVSGPDETEATVTIGVEEARQNIVKSVENDLIGNATVRLFGKGVYTDAKSEGRIIAEKSTEDDGTFDLPTDFEGGDDELVLTAQKGDWFATKTFDATEITTVEDYGELILDRQILTEPSTTEASDGDRFGTVTIWRHVLNDTDQDFYIEVTNNKKHVGYDPWLIVETEASTGPHGGNFLFAYPEDTVSIRENSGLRESDSAKSEGIQVLATHQPQLGFCCNEPFDTPDPLEPSPAGFLHPMRDHSGLPLYETTKNLGRFSSLEDPPSVGAGWHEITPESSDQAEKVSERLESGIKFPAEACDLFNVSCGPGFLLDILDRLTWMTKLLDGGKREAKINHTPNAPVVNDQAPKTVFDVWRSDEPSPFEEAHEASVVYRAPVQSNTNDPDTYSVQTEWVHPYNNRGQFSATVSTAPIDVEVTKTQPELDWSVGGTYKIDITFINRSLTSRTITKVDFVSKNDSVTRNTEINLDAGEEISLIDMFSVEVEKTGTFETEITVEDKQGGTVTRISKFDVAGEEESVEIVNETLEPPTVEVGESTQHTLSFDARNVSADGTGAEFADEFDVTFPEEVILERYSNVDIDAQFSDVEQSGNTLTFSVSPGGGRTTQISVKMDVTLSPTDSQ